MSILINDNTARVQYVATSGQTAFTVPFEFFVNSDLKVYKNGTLLTITTHYTVTGAGVTGGGSITLVTGATAGDIVTVVRDIPVKRITDFPLSGPFNISALNTQLDQLTAMIQEADTSIKGRVVALADSDIPNALTAIPLKDVRANSLFWWDNDGQPSVIGGSDLATVVAFGNSVADTYTGDGTTTVYALSENPGSVNNLLVSVNGVVKIPTVDYTWTVGTTMTFTTAPSAGHSILIRYSRALTEAAPIADGAVSTAKLGGDITAAGKAILDDANAAAQRVTLGLGSIATLAAPAGTVVGTSDTQTLTNKTLSSGSVDAGVGVTDTGTIASTSVGFRGVPRTTTWAGTSADLVHAGKVVAISAGVTINPSIWPAGQAVSFYNDSASSVTITQGTSFTLRQAGTTTTGNRTLAPRGMATLWFNTTAEGVISGPGLS